MTTTMLAPEITLKEAAAEALGLIRSANDSGPVALEAALERLGQFAGQEAYEARVRYHGAWMIDHPKENWRYMAAVKAVRDTEKALGFELPYEQARVISMACTGRIWDLIG